jgi:hypothetical protein
MTATKATALTAATTMAANDIVYIVADPGGSPTSKKITVSNFYANVVVQARFANTLTANTLVFGKRSTPSTSSDTAANGSMWFDTNYIYCATANNTIKRVALSAF